MSESGRFDYSGAICYPDMDLSFNYGQQNKVFLSPPHTPLPEVLGRMNVIVVKIYSKFNLSHLSKQVMEKTNLVPNSRKQIGKNNP
jgi:hypothetical protein